MSTLTDFTVNLAGGAVIFDSKDFVQIRARKSVTHESDSFQAMLWNTAGSKVGLLKVGQEVEIFHDIINPPQNQIFFGRVEFIDYDSDPNREKIRIGGRDFTHLLMDAKVQAVYTSGTSNVSEIGSIVRDIIWTSPFSGTVGVVNVSGTNRILDSFRVKNRSVYEAVKQLADIAGYDFFLDFSKDLNFAPIANTSTGYNIGTMNVESAKIETNAQGMFNQITVYGGRTFTTEEETKTADGGSVYTLETNPHNTNVDVGGTQKKGGVFELVEFAPTGTQYLVDFDEKRIIFVSGTEVGDNIPTSGTDTITITYDKSTPIIKEAVDDASIGQFGVKENVITNTEITDPKQAQDIANAELNRTRLPLVQGVLNLTDSSISGIQPGETISVLLPNSDVSGAQFKVFETTYDITVPKLLSDSTIQVRFGNRINNVSDVLQDIILKQRELQAQQTDTSDVISRLRTITGSMGMKTNWFIRTRTDIGSGFVLGQATRGDLGSGTNQANPQTFLGDSRSALAIVQSGGDFT